MNSEHQHHLNLELATSSLILDIFFKFRIILTWVQSTLIFVAGLFAAAGSDQGNISQHLVPYEKRFYGQGNISPHSVPFKKRSDWGHISPHCVFFKISFQTSEIDWGNISPHLMSFKKVLWLLKLSSIKFYSFSLFLRGPIKSLHQLLFFFMKSKFFSQCQSYIRRNLKTLLFSSVSLF